MPLLGLVADHSGPRGVFVVLALIPLIAVAISTALREPAANDHQEIPAREWA